MTGMLIHVGLFSSDSLKQAAEIFKRIFSREPHILFINPADQAGILASLPADLPYQVRAYAYAKSGSIWAAVDAMRYEVPQ